MQQPAPVRSPGRWLAWALVAVVVVLAVGVVLLSTLNRDTPQNNGWPVLLEALAAASVITTATVGAVVVTRRPGNAVGWLLVVAPVPNVVAACAEVYGVYTLFTRPGALPGGAVAAWFSSWAGTPGLFAGPALLLLLFPDGRVPGPRWRWVPWMIVVSTLAATVDAALIPVLDEVPFEGIANPTPYRLPDVVLWPVSLFGWQGMAAGLLVAAAGMLTRLRRSRGIERRQLKWVAAAAALLPPVAVAGVAAYYAGQDVLGSFLVVYASLPIPLVAGYAILRHRLFDVELVIRRALVYGSATALLAAGYAALVLVLQATLRPLTSDSSPAVALSTLAVAVLFRPVRQRAQQLIDRRFDRSRYDAARTLAAFSSRLRAQTDLDALGHDLSQLVHTALKPAHMSLWLRGDAAGR